jgi:hypothetical protein
METPGADDIDDDFHELGGFGDDELDADAKPESAGGDDLLEDDEASSSEAAPSRSRSAGHRSIPSWDEAIGMIVEANMQTRSQRRPSPHSGQRGRSRGGRRRRKPS